MNSSDVAKVEELSEPEFTSHADMSVPSFFQCFQSCKAQLAGLDHHLEFKSKQRYGYLEH